MPDYNPAVALGIQPPPDTIPQTLNTINQLQIGQAHVGLYQLQLRQDQIEQNARQAAAQAGAANEDMAKAYFANGGRDATLGNGYQSFQSGQRSSINGVLPAQQEQEAATSSSLASAAKTRAEIPGAVAGSLKGQAEADAAVAKTYGPGVLVNPSDDEAYQGLVNGHYDALSVGVPQNSPQAAAIAQQRQAALAVTDPQQRTAAAIRYGTAAGVPVQDLAKTFNLQQPGQSGQHNAQNAPANAPIGLRNPADVEATSKAADLQVEQGQKTYAGIQAQASQYERDLKPLNTVARSILNDPRIYTGIGGETALDMNRVKALFGDQKAAVLQEALTKVTAASVLSQINTQRDQLQEAGGTSSRIFSSQIEQVEKASASLGNTVAGNRFLVNVQDRLGSLSSKIAQMARDYRTDHPKGLDTGFDQQVADYMQKNPVFTQQEQNHPDWLSAPDTPSNAAKWTPQQAVQWGATHGLKPGDVVHMNNSYVRIPQLRPSPNG